MCFQGSWCWCPVPAGQLGWWRPSLPGQTWLWSPLLAPQVEGTTSLLTTPASLQLTQSLLHCSRLFISFWAESSTVRVKQWQGLFGGHRKTYWLCVSLGSLLFSFSPSWQCNFWAPTTGPLVLLMGRGKICPQGPRVPGDTVHQARDTHLLHTHTPRKQFTVSDLSSVTLDGNSGWQYKKNKGR